MRISNAAVLNASGAFGQDAEWTNKRWILLRAGEGGGNASGKETDKGYKGPNPHTEGFIIFDFGLNWIILQD